MSDDDLGELSDEAGDAAAQRLMDAYVADYGVEHAWVVNQLIDAKRNYLGGSPDKWTPMEMSQVLFEIYPAKVMLEPADLPVVPVVAAQLMRVLASADPHDDKMLGEVADVIEGQVTLFVSQMSDEDNWSFGKRMWSTATAEGVDLDDQAAINAWMEDFNSRSFEERDQILGRLPGGGRIGGGRPSFPPVKLPPQAEVDASLAEAVLLQRLVKLCEFVGEGRQLTDTGNLRLADGKELVEVLGTDDIIDGSIGDRVFTTRSSVDLPQVDLTYRLAMAANLLERSGRKVVPGSNSPLGETVSLELADVAFEAVVDEFGFSEHRRGKDTYGFGWFSEVLDEELIQTMVSLYAGGPAEIGDEVDRIWDMVQRSYDLRDVDQERLDLHRRGFESDLRFALRQFELMGIVSVEGVTAVTGKYGLDRDEGGTVALAPVGWRVLHAFVAGFADAPVLGELRSLPAHELLSKAADLSEAEARGEIEMWIDDRPSTAAAELASAMETASATELALAYHALLGMGPEVATVLMEREALAHVTVIFAVDSLLAKTSDVDLSGDPQRWIELIATVIDLWGSEAAAIGWAEPAAGAPGLEAMLNEAWRVPGDATATVLSAVGASHPSKGLAKAARKALFKHRSAAT